jgi:hypothetical protein
MPVLQDRAENRIDQRMPLEPDHRLLSPFQKERSGTRFKFPAENQPVTVVQGDAVVRLTLFTTMEGLPACYFVLSWARPSVSFFCIQNHSMI